MTLQLNEASYSVAHCMKMHMKQTCEAFSSIEKSEDQQDIIALSALMSVVIGALTHWVLSIPSVFAFDWSARNWSVKNYSAPSDRSSADKVSEIAHTALNESRNIIRKTMSTLRQTYEAFSSIKKPKDQRDIIVLSVLMGVVIGALTHWVLSISAVFAFDWSVKNLSVKNYSAPSGRSSADKVSAAAKATLDDSSAGKVSEIANTDLNESGNVILSRAMFPPHERQVREPVGLTNPASICYFNSLIQILFASPQLRGCVNKDILAPIGGSEQEVKEYGELCGIQNALRTLMGKYDEAKTPEELTDARDKAIYRIFSYMQKLQGFDVQQDNANTRDASIASILSYMPELQDYARVTSIASIRSYMSELQDRNERQCKVKLMGRQQDFAEFMDFCLDAIGYSFKVTKFLSAGNFASEKEEFRHALRLPIFEEGKKNLQELVNWYASKKRIHAEWLHFPSHEEAYAISSTIPNVLIIQLVRFKSEEIGVWKKIERQIGIGEDGMLDLKEWISQDLRNKDANGGSTKYCIRSFAIHKSARKGDIHHGHYIACVRKGVQWYRLNDAQNPEKLTLEEALQMAQGAYVFVYEREVDQNAV